MRQNQKCAQTEQHPEKGQRMTGNRHADRRDQLFNPFPTSTLVLYSTHNTLPYRKLSTLINIAALKNNHILFVGLAN